MSFEKCNIDDFVGAELVEAKPKSRFCGALPFEKCDIDGSGVV